tara:strand:+ start:4354 stop:5031 length:678 start_codon:yes stop_codon:yes gene_type:complete
MTSIVENQDNKDSEKKKEPTSPEPSHIMEGEYAVLQETNGEEFESWFYFIRKEGNEEALQHLQTQLESVDWYIIDGLSTFDLDLEHFVSAKTAKEMTKIELNAYAFHRKFDGKLSKIEFNFRKKDKTKKKIEKAFDVLGYGQIEDFIDDEDLDPEDLTDTEYNTDEDSDSESESESDSQSDSQSDTNDKKSKKDEIKGGIPPALLKDTRPGWAKAKGKKKGNKKK